VTAPLVALRAGTWTVSDSRTTVTFSVGNLGHRAHGSVACSWGELRLDDEGRPIAVRAELDLTSLDTGIAKRDRDLRKPHFLDIDRQPTMTWTADRFAPAGDGAWTASGVLSVRGTSTELAVTGTPELAEDGALRVRGHAVLDRTTVGIRAPSFLIGRTVEIEVDAWLVRAPRG
jgi:polyisoprenoid-binding protein YceI